MMTQEYDVIVIGAGVNGLATAWYLVTKEKKRVLILEQFPFPHARGGSSGHSRITRRVYEEGHFTHMMKEAYPLWEEIGRLAGETLFVKSGMLWTGPEEVVKSSQKAMAVNNLPCETMSYEEVHKIYPQISGFEGMRFLFDHEAGLLIVQKCLLALRTLLASTNATFKDCEKVTAIIPVSDNEVIVRTPQSVYKSRAVVVNTGPWTGKFMADLGLHLPLRTEKVQVTYWRAPPGTSASFHWSHFPVIADESHKTYTMPECEYPNCIKVVARLTVPVDPDENEKARLREDHMEILRNYVRKHYPLLEDEPTVVESCIYTHSLDKNYILDHHPKFHNVVFGTGYSGTGFKTAPVVGKILGRMALGLDTGYDLSMYKLDRFQMKSKI